MYNITNMTTTTKWTDNGPVKNYTFEFDFDGKEQYLAQTTEWKAAYKELSKNIRQCKLWRKPSQRPQEVHGGNNLSTLDHLQTEARQMCQMRVQAKVESARRMMEHLQAA